MELTPKQLRHIGLLKKSAHFGKWTIILAVFAGVTTMAFPFFKYFLLSKILGFVEIHSSSVSRVLGYLALLNEAMLSLAIICSVMTAGFIFSVVLMHLDRRASYKIISQLLAEKDEKP